jgi:hypothetical protein
LFELLLHKYTGLLIVVFGDPSYKVLKNRVSFAAMVWEDG